MKKLIKNWLPVLAWCLLIFYVSSLPKLPKLKTTFFDYLLKNGAHFTEYAVLYYLVLRALGYKRYFLGMLLTGLYALSDEFHKMFVPGRIASVYDLAVDIMGMFFTLILVKKGKE